MARSVYSRTFQKASELTGGLKKLARELRVPIAETIRLGEFEFAGETVTYPGPGPTASIGAAVLGEFRVSFDAGHRRVRFER